jgi:hypothetical protein
MAAGRRSLASAEKVCARYHPQLLPIAPLLAIPPASHRLNLLFMTDAKVFHIRGGFGRALCGPLLAASTAV